MLHEEFDTFFAFCTTHGNSLRHHKAFAEMGRELRIKIFELEKENNLMRLQLKGIYCQYCGELLVHHIVSEKGGQCRAIDS